MKKYALKISVSMIAILIAIISILGTFSMATETADISSTVENRAVFKNIVNMKNTIEALKEENTIVDETTNENAIEENTSVTSGKEFLSFDQARNLEKKSIEDDIDEPIMGSGMSSQARMIFFIIQFVLMASAAILFINGIVNVFHNKKVDKARAENAEGAEDLRKKITILYFIFSIMLFMAGEVLQMIRNFALKPIIYIYPNEKTKVSVKMQNKDKLLVSYPKYEDGWEVEAEPSGDLVDLKTGRKLYALYWEGITDMKVNFKEGFVVSGEDTRNFLEEKLELLGLNEREAEEFIVYWLPLMEKNKYNFIKFRLTDEVEEDMPLDISPKPETLIRINMAYKPLPFKIEVKEQYLPRQERKGYTVIEWGGTRIH